MLSFTQFSDLVLKGQGRPRGVREGDCMLHHEIPSPL